MLEIAGVVIATEALGDFMQTYEPIAGRARLRMMDGTGVQQSWWTKLRTTLSATGWWPPGLDGIDYGAVMTLRCAAPRTLQSAGNIIAIPTARRTDIGYTPQGYAVLRGASPHVGGGDLVPVSISIAGDIATLGVITGAVGYQVAYWPELTVLADPPTIDTDTGGATHRWTLTAEEV